MEKTLTYDLMLEVSGVLRSLDLRVRLNRELSLGDTIRTRGRRWVVTDVHPALQSGLDVRAIAREIVEARATP
jgi:hypothetical protein